MPRKKKQIKVKDADRDRLDIYYQEMAKVDQLLKEIDNEMKGNA